MPNKSVNASANVVSVRSTPEPPRKFSAGEWFAAQQIKIPRDVVADTQMIVPGPNSRPGYFFAQATTGNGLMVPFSVDRPLLGRQIEAMGGIDSDIIVTQPNWFAIAAKVLTIAGTTIDLRQLFPAEVLCYKEIPPSYTGKRSQVNDRMVPVGNASTAYQFLAIIPCHGAKSVSIMLVNRTGSGVILSWFVMASCFNVPNDLSIGTPTLGATPVEINTVIDPYVVGGASASTSVGPAAPNTLAEGFSDSRFFTNLQGEYLMVIAKVSAGTPALSNFFLNWEVRD